MNILTTMRRRVDRLAACAELDVEAPYLPASAGELSDESVMLMLAEAAALANDVGRLQAVLAGIAGQRSRREDGHSGLAAVHGHVTATALIQSITGGTKADASRQVRVGTSLLEGGLQLDGTMSAVDADSTDTAAAFAPELPWHDPLRRALLEGRLTAAQHDAIRRGLGEPPVPVGGRSVEAVEEAWSIAAEQFMAETATMTVEELAKRARAVRDMLDPVGAEERFGRRYLARGFRMWIDGDGQHHARITFDDEMALWVRAVLDAALRPRRGGPRFVTDDERAVADNLNADPRSNEQLEYDLVMDLLHTGSLAAAKDVFGARQPGVRMLVVKDALGPRDAFGRLIAVGHAEDGGDTLPGSVIDRNVCSLGSVEVTVDRHGDPLNLGREQRLYTARQRVTLAARDGGCLWPGCQRPASYCEAHHCDHFVEDDGRTDIDRGCLLCRFHHMLLHNNGWRISRSGNGPFLLHPPVGEGEPIVLKSKAPWKWGWDPPPPPPRSNWRESTDARAA